MGTYRFCLAVLVALSHFGIAFFGYAIGVVAVISFLLLSGFVMTLLLEKHYRGLVAVPNYYLDRLYRICPQFFLYSIITFLLLSYTDIGKAKLPWMDYEHCTPLQIGLGFTMFANNFWWDFVNCQLIPTSWSLGLELCFYLCVPFILMLSFGKRAALLILSATVFFVAYLGILDFDKFAYRLLPGTLFIFLTGSSIARPALYAKYYPVIVFCLALVLAVVAANIPSLSNQWLLKDVLAGITLGIPLVFIVSRVKPGKIDDLLGNLSYGIFLNHILVLWLYVALFGTPAQQSFNVLTIVGCLGVSVTFSYLSFRTVERYFLNLRKGLRTS